MLIAYHINASSVYAYENNFIDNELSLRRILLLKIKTEKYGDQLLKMYTYN